MCAECGVVCWCAQYWTLARDESTATDLITGAAHRGLVFETACFFPSVETALMNVCCLVVLGALCDRLSFALRRCFRSLFCLGTNLHSSPAWFVILHPTTYVHEPPTAITTIKHEQETREGELDK